jgi:hypothetical protein
VSYTWSFRDVGVLAQPASGVASSDVRYRQHAAGAGSYGSWVYPASLQRTTASSAKITAARGVATCWQVRARDRAGNVSGWHGDRCSQVEGSVPQINSVNAGPRVVSAAKTTALKFSFGATDNIGVASYDVAYRLARPGQSLGAWTYPSSWQRTRARSVSLRVAPGEEVCWRVRARDAAGGTSAWSDTRCSAVPYDDRAFAAKGSVRRTTDSRALNKTVTVLGRKGARLSRSSAQGRTVALVAIVGPNQGAVEVRVGGKLLRRVSLASRTTHRAVIALPHRSFKGAITITSVSSRPARIDGLAVLRSSN